MVVNTDRLHLVAIDAALAPALAGDAGELAAALGVDDAGIGWPPAMFAEHLGALAEATIAGSDDELGWWCWAIVQHAEAVDQDEETGAWEIEPLEEGPRLVGLAVFLGPPIPNPEDEDAAEEEALETSLAIALIDDLTGYGLGTEAFSALTAWAFEEARGDSQPARLLSDVLNGMDAAKHMLRKCGYRRLSVGSEPGSEIFCLDRP